MKNKVVAALLAFFVGWLGVHKFYLGENGAGILYILFCWTGIPGIIAFFEFFFILLMSDEAFNAKYNNVINYGSAYSAIPKESSKDKTDTLMNLKKLYDSGVITAEEYEQKRRKFLDSL
ncbi:MAG: NINE protein [Xenococcaceae cyanobacterium MO_207.B15]|nr:NINE protein [Xenococcaceae cyanobacterium MO_207.B15]MDJ0744823.1 NINE protein [Xenococcaceae cyanobacterium MO_167.B27]